MQQIGMRVDFLNALQEISKELLGLGPIYARDKACSPPRITAHFEAPPRRQG
jgi:hypothetical protein